MGERDERLRGIRDAHRSWHDARERCDYASMDSIEGKRYHMDVEWLLSEIERLRKYEPRPNLRVEEAAAILDILPQSMTALIDAGAIPHRVTELNQVLVKLSDVEAYRDKRDAARREALAQMTREAEAMGLYGVKPEAV